MLVTAQWLNQLQNQNQIAVVDCRFQLADPAWGYRQYLQGHIPGAYYLDLERDLSAPASSQGRHPLPDSTLLAEKLAAIGIVKGETLVVAYDSSRFAFAARLWWLLRYLGHDRVALLDGGWLGWHSQGYPTTEALPSPRQGRFEPQPRPNSTVGINELKVLPEEVPADALSKLNDREDLPSVVLIDSRDRDRYLGVREPIDPVAGHIPGAVNSPWQAVTDEQGYLHPSACQQLWADYRDADEIIVYCGSGVTACVNLFSLALAGVEQTKLYPGGWSEWCYQG